MAKTNAELQQAYRQRQREADARRLEVQIHYSALFALDRLARHTGTSRREVLERLLLDADDKLAQTLTSAEWDTYHRTKYDNPTEDKL